MAQRDTGKYDRSIEVLVSLILQAGVILAALIVMTGGCLFLARYGSAAPDYRVFRGEPTDLKGVAGIWADVLRLRARGLIQFGLLVLIATPVLRVAFSVFAFLAERDWLYVLVTLLVLILLVLSLAGILV